MTLVHLTWQKLLAGGLYMFPLFCIGFVMFTLIVHSLGTHYRLSRTFSKLRDEDADFTELDANLAGLMAEYRQSRCPVPELNVRLREELSQNFFTRLSVEGKAVLLCGSVALLMGLLGTVSGMINAFEAIQVFGVGNTKSFAAGISEALLTTQSGLLVGVVGIVAGRLLQRRHKRLQLKLYRYFESVEHRVAEQSGAYGHGA